MIPTFCFQIQDGRGVRAGTDTLFVLAIELTALIAIVLRLPPPFCPVALPTAGVIAAHRHVAPCLIYNKQRITIYVHKRNIMFIFLFF